MSLPTRKLWRSGANRLSGTRASRWLGQTRASPRPRRLQIEALESRQLLALSPFLLADLAAGAGDSSPHNALAISPWIYFDASTPTTGSELWRTDGTTLGTTPVLDIQSGAVGSDPQNLTDVGGTLFFTADNGANGRELWKSDGTPGGTTLVKDIRSGATGSNPTNLTNVGGVLFFFADDGAVGRELWKSDGTPGGTILVKDIFASGSRGSDPNYMVAMGGVAYFAANGNDGKGQELWKSDGTGPGTSRVLDIYPGGISSYPAYLTAVGSTLYFQADDGTHGQELWKSDGTGPGTSFVKDIYAGFDWGAPFQFAAIGSNVYFFADSGTGVGGTGEELWKSDGTSGGTVLVKDINPGTGSSFGYYLTAAQDRLYFYADDGSTGGELWTSDGTTDGTTIAQDARPGALGSEPWMLTPIGNRVLYRANDGSHGDELWISNGDLVDTKMIADLRPDVAGSNPNAIVVLNNAVFWGANDGSSGQEPWFLAANAAPTAIALAPQAVMDSAEVGTLVGNLSTTDPTVGDAHRYTLVAGAGSTNNNLFSITGDKLYVAGPISPAVDTLSIRVRTTDQALESIDQVITLSVVHTTLVPNGMFEKQPIGTEVGLFGTSNDPAGGPFAYAFATGVGSADNGKFTLVGNQLKTNYYFDALTQQQAYIRVEVTDGLGRTFQKAFIVTITNESEAPVAVDDTFYKTVDLPANIAAPGVLWNDYSPDPGVTLTAYKVSDPAHGSVTVNLDGSFVYTPTVGYHGHDEFNYKVYDGIQFSAPAKVTINNRPVGVTDNYNVDEDSSLTKNVADGVLANDYDVDPGDTILLTAAKLTDPLHGVLTFSTDGSFTYTPSPNYFGPDSFTYTAGDTDPNSRVTVTVNLTVNPMPDNPVALDDTYPNLADSILRVPFQSTTPPIDLRGLLNNDYDLDQQTLTASWVSGPSNGMVTISPDGSFVYTPNHPYSPNVPSVDSFVYRVTDPTGRFDDATVTINRSPAVDTITVKMPPSVWEGAGDVSQGGLLTIPNPQPIDVIVYLTSSAPTKLAVPPTVVIPAGATAVAFDFTVPDDNVVAPTQSAVITAEPRGLIANTTSTLVRDNEADHFQVGNITSPKTAGAYFPITVTAKNASNETIISYASPVTVTGESNSTSVPVTTQGSIVFVGGVATVNVAVQAVANNVTLTVSDGLGHSGPPSNSFDVQGGVFDHFVLTGSGGASIGSPQKVGTAFPITAKATDSHGFTVDTFNGTAALTGWVNGGSSAPRVVISECSDGTPDYFEIQNVSGTTLNNTGNWKVALNDATAIDGNGNANINAVTGTTWSLPASLTPGQVVYKTDDTNDSYFGQNPPGTANIWWGSSTSKGWAMILDDAYKVVDLVAWGYTSSQIATMAPVVDGRTISVGSAWAGAGVAYGGSDVASLQRFSDRDSNSAADFHWVSRTKGTINVAQSTTYVNATPVPISPTGSGSFTAGVWTGNVVVQHAATGMYLLANDGQNRTGVSNAFDATGTLNLTDTAGTYDPATSMFFLKNQNSTGFADIAFGYGAAGAGWIPIAGDWDGDGKTTVGLFDKSTSLFYLRNSNSTGMADLVVGFGAPGANQLPIVGDWNGDGRDTIGLYYPDTSVFFLRDSNSTGYADYAFGFGAGGMGWQPISGNWDGTGGESIGLYDSTTSLFYLRNSLSTGMAEWAFGYGAATGTWRSIAGDWNADGIDTVGLQDPATAVYYLTNSSVGGYADVAFAFGAASGTWYPLAGNWLGTTGTPLLAADGPIDAAAKPITADTLQPLVEAALARWAELAVPRAALDAMRDTQFVIADLPGAQLGLAADRTVYIDPTAAGRGWFVDATPNDDVEFAPGATDPKAAARADLLTAVAHELGHAAGLDHTSIADDVMNELLPSGVRRSPKSSDIDALFSRIGSE